MTGISHSAAERLYVAFDFESIKEEAPQYLLTNLRGTGIGVKLGLEITAASGWVIPIDTAQDYNYNVFADAKLKDIGNTVIKVGKTILKAYPNFLNIHADSSETALRGLVDVRNKVQIEGWDDYQDDGEGITKLLGVTVLTDITDEECIKMYGRTRKEQVLFLADKVLDCGLDGLVCSPEELDILAKYSRFDRLIRMIPAIRPKWSVPDDQKNFTTPREAILRGANYLVVGRPITEQYKKIGDTPLDATEAVVQEIAEAA